MSIIINNISFKHANSHYNFLLLSLGFHVFVKLYHFTASQPDALMDKEWLCPVSFQCDANRHQYRLIFHELESPCKVNYPGMFAFFLSSIFSACHPASRCNLFHLHKDTYLYFLKITSVVKPHPSERTPIKHPIHPPTTTTPIHLHY